MRTIKAVIKIIGLLSFAGLAGLGYAFFTGMIPVKEVGPPVEVPVRIRTVDIIELNNPRVDPDVATKISSLLDEIAPGYGVMPEIMACIGFQESGYDPLCVSSTGDLGVYGINYEIHKELIKSLGYTKDQVFHLRPNTILACRIMSEKTKAANGDVAGGIQGYAGLGKKKYVPVIYSLLGKAYAELN